MTDYKAKYLKYKKKYFKLKQQQQQSGGGYSEIFVYNNLNNTIEKIDYSNFDDKIHTFVSDKDLEKIAKHNFLKIKKIVSSEKNYKKKFYHTSAKIFEYPMLDKQSDFTSWLGNGVYKNPKGIWLSCGLSWQNYISNHPSPWSLGTYIYEIEPNFDNVLHISNLKELNDFINFNMKSNPKISNVIDWKKVKKTYDGLIICPYLGNKIWGKNANRFGLYGSKNVDDYLTKIITGNWKNKLFFTAEWYRHWEEATGVIWKPSTGIKSIKLIEKININYK